MSEAPLTIQALGECALTLTVGTDLPSQRRLWAAWHALQQRLPEVEWVLGMGNLSGRFDPLVTAARLVEKALEGAWTHSLGGKFGEGRVIEIPVRYGGEQGPDLAVVAALLDLAESEVIERHTAAEYVVYCLGFLPGFAYLGGLDARIAVPRRAEPRRRVPAGSVGIAGNQTGVYPLASPGGWQLIGRSDIQLFDPYRETPVLLAPGDTVRFVAVP
ncbi:5-oxoprolinase subunit PxpB [Chitinolyticbacter albus]|uniref:5-oxoprolinase subunit PxpB n=1 Tax=Chitinolyticbacter albus TaxID=2961951 RepID=UPI00210A5F48|nr:5-oxoprolinase subunit PxpB [Chitinolyticbacter albus]